VYNRKWRAANPEKKREASRNWEAANPKKANARKRRWEAANLEKERDRNHRRRAQTASPDPDTIAYMKVLENGPCSYCGGPSDTVDHIDPLAPGGEHHWTNLTAACKSCNSKKGTKTLLEFLLASS
jgi:5-methylcytosine-specific restriction endonuclease McrA